MKNVLLINAMLLILFLSDTYEGSAHDKRIADGTPYPLPSGSKLLQDLGFLAFVLDGVECITPETDGLIEINSSGRKAAAKPWPLDGNHSHPFSHCASFAIAA